jgi:hypothetical protein
VNEYAGRRWQSVKEMCCFRSVDKCKGDEVNGQYRWGSMACVRVLVGHVAAAQMITISMRYVRCLLLIPRCSVTLTGERA